MVLPLPTCSMTQPFARRLTSMSPRSSCAYLLVAALAACAGENTSARDSERQAATAGIVITTAADADALVPPLVATTAGKQVMDLLFDHLADPSDVRVRTDGDQGFTPRLARRWHWSADSLSIAFEIDSAARWHDGAPVTAADVRFSWRFYTDPSVGSMHARGFAGIDSVSVRDRQTAVVWWSHRHPEQFFQIAYNLSVMPEHLLGAMHADSIATSAFANHPIGSGRYRFEKWDRKRQLILSADSTNYRGRPTFDRVIWIIAPDPNAATAAILSGQADVLEVLRGDAVTRAGQVPTLKTVEYGSLDYGYLVFNQRPGSRRGVSFGDRAMRVALSAAVDRAAIVHNALDSLGRVALGPVTRSEPTADTTMRSIAFDTAAAAPMLDSLGWRWDARKSMRMRNGKVLAFSILVPASSATRQKLAVLLQAQFASIGASVAIDAVESGVFAARMHDGDFDTALNAWRNDPSPTSIRQSWGSAHGDDVGANFGRYSSATFDATVDSAIVTFNPQLRTALFRRAYQHIVDDAPAIWLYEPRNLAAVRTRLVPKGIRADAWLAGLADWQVQSVKPPATVARAGVP